MTGHPALALRGIEKSFGGAQALAGASLVVERGTVHGLVGQNGAGKSTLIKVLAGIHAPDAGSIEIDGKNEAHLSPHHVETLGIHMIHQDRLLPPTLTVAEALLLGNEPRFARTPFINRRQLERQAAEALWNAFQVALPVRALIRDLATAEQQIVQITRALVNKPKILVLDEPTAALVHREAEMLFETIERLKSDGLTVLYISHYLSEIERLCDQVTVLRNGRDVARVSPKTTSTAEIVSLMIDRDVDSCFPARPPRRGEPLIQTDGLGNSPYFSDVTFTLRKGEIVGVTGLVGSGAKALAGTLFGLSKADAGTVLLKGRPLAAPTPAAAVARRIGLVPEDRRRHGISLDLSVRENATLPALPDFTRRGLIRAAREKNAVAGLVARLGIKTSGPEALLRTLSGGNQQKVVLSKWLIHQSELIILDEPTVGVDVGAKVDIYREISRLADEGAGVLMISSDLLELTGLADRVLVFHRGRLVADLHTAGLDQDMLLALITTGAAPKESNAPKEHHALAV
jgi:ribose transport system ATP-binding protein